MELKEDQEKLLREIILFWQSNGFKIRIKEDCVEFTPRKLTMVKDQTNANEANDPT